MKDTVTTYQILALIFQAIGILAALFLGAVALFREQLNAKFRPPVLTITRSESAGQISKHQDESLFMYYHMDVLNNRPTSVAKECKVVLIAFQRQKVGGWIETIIPVPPYFYWAPMDKKDEPLLNIFDYRRFDFLILKKGSDRIGLRLNRPFHNMDWDIYANIRMRYVLQVEAMNGRSRRQTFEVAWDGKWTFDNPESILIEETFE